MSEKLTKAQRDRLRTIVSYTPSKQWPHAAYWETSRTDQSLARRGLVERIRHETVLGGGASASKLKVVWNLCRITDAGREALRLAKGDQSQ